MAETIKQDEGFPVAYPAPPPLSDKAAQLDHGAIWRRFEAYTAIRFTPRVVTWIVNGAGQWSFPLRPIELAKVELWERNGWRTVYPLPSPLGGLNLEWAGTYRITATVGGGNVPPDVMEAFRRLAEYSVDIGKDGMMGGHPSHTQHSAEIGSGLKESYSRSPTWAARSLQLSGAADLLRPYRRH